MYLKQLLSSKKKKKPVPLLKEVTGGTVAGYVGGKGMGIDALFAGPFHPDSGHGSENEKVLKQQLKDRKKKLKDTNSEEVNPVGGWYEVETEISRLAYDELLAKNQFNMKFNTDVTPVSDVKWKSIGWDYNYDDIYTRIEKNYINSSKNNLELVGVDIKYDDKPQYTDVNFINKSTKNWKYIGSNRNENI